MRSSRAFTPVLDAAAAHQADVDVGPWIRDGTPRFARGSLRPAECLLRRPGQPLAARHQREHEPAAAPVLSKGPVLNVLRTRGPRPRREAQPSLTYNSRGAATTSGRNGTSACT